MKFLHTIIGLILPAAPLLSAPPEPAQKANPEGMQAEAVAHPAGSVESGYNCLFIGHSFFIPVAKRFSNMPAQCGVKNHRQQEIFSPSKSGSPRRLWEDEEKRKSIQGLLDAGDIELLGMTYFDPESSAVEDYKRWMDYALKCNPKTTFFIGLSWVRFGGETPLAEYQAKNAASNASISATVAELRKLYPDNQIIFFNYGVASIELKRLFESGNLPEIKALVGQSSDTIYQDETGHASPILRDLSALLWMKAIYGASCEKIVFRPGYKVDLKQLAETLYTGDLSSR